jgi:hypothetical protein
MSRLTGTSAGWLGAVVLATLGTALVFVGVTVSGVFLPGVVLIDGALLLAAGTGLWQLRPGSAVEQEGHAD